MRVGLTQLAPVSQHAPKRDAHHAGDTCATVFVAEEGVPLVSDPRREFLLGQPGPQPQTAQLGTGHASANLLPAMAVGKASVRYFWIRAR